MLLVLRNEPINVNYIHVTTLTRYGIYLLAVKAAGASDVINAAGGKLGSDRVGRRGAVKDGAGKLSGSGVGNIPVCTECIQ